MTPLKKCIVLDLDNTLWGGVIGEDGMDGIALSVTPPGASFLAFQQALRDHFDRGIILAINSRNNPDDAWEAIRKHPNMVLREEHFAAARMNWNDKAENMRELANELNIGLDAMVFFDDDPTNRALMRAMLPEVETPELPADPAEYAQFLHSLPYFPAGATTDEDKMRGNLYVTERLRKESEKQYDKKEDFLANLGLELFVHEDDASAAARLAQLSEKTNQFNADKQPFSEAEIAAFVQDPATRVFHARLTDKFGDYGVIGFALAERKDRAWHLRSLLMSCRALGRNVEEAFFSAIAERAKADGAERITISVRETEKNAPAREFAAAHFTDGARDLAALPEAPAWVKIKRPA